MNLWFLSVYLPVRGSPEGGPPSEIIPISHGNRGNGEAYVSSSIRQMESCHLEGELSTNCALAVTTAVAANTRRRPGADALGRFDRQVTVRASAPHGSGRRGVCRQESWAEHGLGAGRMAAPGGARDQRRTSTPPIRTRCSCRAHGA